MKRVCKLISRAVTTTEPKNHRVYVKLPTTRFDILDAALYVIRVAKTAHVNVKMSEMVNQMKEGGDNYSQKSFLRDV